MGTKNNPGAFDCYANAEPDEPMFVLLGRDKFAPTLVWLWAQMRELEGEDPAKCQEAITCMSAMIEWQAGLGRKSVGLAHATIVGVMGLMRAANFSIEKALNDKATTDDVRLFLEMCQTKIGADEDEKGKEDQ